MTMIYDSLKKTVTVNRLCWLWAQILRLQVTLQWCTFQHTYCASLMFDAKSKHFDLCLEIQTCNYWTIMQLPWQRKSISPDTQSCWAPLIRASTHFTSTTKTIFKSKSTYCHFSNAWYGNNKMQFPRKPWCWHLTLYLQHSTKQCWSFSKIILLSQWWLYRRCYYGFGCQRCLICLIANNKN